jgi:hypothetical protein
MYVHRKDSDSQDITPSNTMGHIARLTLKNWTKSAKYYMFCYVMSTFTSVYTALTVSAETGTKLPLCKHVTLRELLPQNGNIHYMNTLFNIGLKYIYVVGKYVKTPFHKSPHKSWLMVGFKVQLNLFITESQGTVKFSF